MHSYLPIRKIISKFIYLLFLVSEFSSCKKDFTDHSANFSETDSQKQTHAAGRQPNIILFIADDLGVEVPTFNGGKSYSTPNLDWMAANGIHFDSAFSHPDGFPSRIALYTGKYNFRNYTIWGVLPETEKTFANMLEDANYSTCFVGKWQNDGGDARIHSAGFQQYLAYCPLYKNDQRKRRYKDPYLYQNGAFLPDSTTKGKYSEDMFSDYVCNFIDTNRDKPFLVVYSHNLVAQPYVPAPDDPAYPTWDVKTEHDNTDVKYFPGMVNYMDKMIGKVIDHVRTAGLEENTIFMFIADNATQRAITSNFRDTIISGTKTQTNVWGTLTPFVVDWKGRLSTNTIDHSLIDYTDFLPTMASIAHIPKPTSYGILDGTTFYDNMIGTKGKNRKWVFCHWDNDMLDNGIVPRERFVNNAEYKLYDTLDYSRFYNIKNDTWEQYPIPNNQLTPYERILKYEFKSILKKMHN